MTKVKQSKTQKCSKCLIEKPLSEFSKLRADSDLYRKTCKTCAVDYSTQWAKKNKEKRRIQDQQRRIAKFGIVERTRKPGSTAKPCTKCNIEKPLEEFPFDSRYSDSRASACNDCKLIQTDNWRRRNLDRVNQRRRERAAEKRELKDFVEFL